MSSRRRSGRRAAHGFESPIDGPTPGSRWIAPAFKDGCAPAAPRRIALPGRTPPPAAANALADGVFGGSRSTTSSRSLPRRAAGRPTSCAPPGWRLRLVARHLHRRRAQGGDQPGIAAAAGAALQRRRWRRRRRRRQSSSESAAEHSARWRRWRHREAAAELEAAAAAAAAAESDAASAMWKRISKAEAAADRWRRRRERLAQTVGYPSDDEADATDTAAMCRPTSCGLYVGGGAGRAGRKRTAARRRRWRRRRRGMGPRRRDSSDDDDDDGAPLHGEKSLKSSASN